MTGKLFLRTDDGREIPIKEVEHLDGGGMLILLSAMYLKPSDARAIASEIEDRIGDGTRVLVLDSTIRQIMRLQQ